MTAHKSIHSVGQSQRRMRKHAQAKITVKSSEAKPYDRAASPALTESVSCVTIILPASSACNDSAEDWADATAPSCFKVRKSSKMARSRRRGLSFPDQRRESFPGYAVRAALKANLENPPER